MLAKPSVVFDNVKPPVWYAIGLIEAIYRAQGLKLIVTSLNDSKHSEASLHYSGEAVDLRTRNVPQDMLRQLVAQVKRTLEPMGYDVVLEEDHLHVEYDAKAGETWWKVVS